MKIMVIHGPNLNMLGIRGKGSMAAGRSTTFAVI